MLDSIKLHFIVLLSSSGSFLIIYLNLLLDLRQFLIVFRRSGSRCSFNKKIQKQALQSQPRMKMATTEQQQHVTPGETATHRNAHTCFWYTQTRDTGKNNIRMIVKTKYK